MDAFLDVLDSVLDTTMMLIALLIVLGFFAITVLYVLDVTQREQAIRRNYPVIGRLRYVFEHLGVFFRQYFFAMDREELPFNRAQRAWVARAAKRVDSTLAFGSTKPLNRPGDIFFLNSAYPPTAEEIAAHRPEPLIFGKGFVAQPYTAPSFFNISAMSYGALSGPAIAALSAGAYKSHIWLNTGEGGLSPFHQSAPCDLVFQIGTAKYGVRDEDGQLDLSKVKTLAAIPALKMFEIKLSQGAKPGKGGILPAEKVTEIIAATRGIPMGQASISPNRHPEVTDAHSLLDFVHSVREASGKPTGIKFVLGDTAWLEELFNAIKQRGIDSAPDFMTLDSADGGTGAAPQGLMDNMGLPIAFSLPAVHQKLKEAGLRDRIKLIATGKMLNPAGVAAALCLGADVVCSARGFMFALGCIQALQCHHNTCPTGITTHDPKLQRGLDPTNKAERVANYASAMRNEVELIAQSAGALDPSMLRPEHAFQIDASGLPISLTHSAVTSA